MEKKYIKKFGALGLAVGILATSIAGYAGGTSPNKAGLVTGEGLGFIGEEVELAKELRSTWVSTVYNLDFPSKKGQTEGEFKEEFLGLLDNVEDLGLNSIIFQVRPKGDAFYESDINPWSEFLTGVEDKSSNWDPMEWMVEETHKRGLEFQAWFNPYRVTTASNNKTTKAEDLAKLSSRNFAKQNPDKVFKYEGRLYLNPGEPEVINYLRDTIMEVVEKYDIDGVHFDDYFYPNKRGDLEAFYSKEEEASFKKYAGGFTRVSDWRRDNINKLIETVSRSIREHNLLNEGSVEFGVSPFGIWGHKANHPEGAPEGVGSNTPTSSLESYRYQFADTRKWVKDGLLDYIAPQIYWTFDEKAAPYAELVNWWSDVVKDTGVKLYIGHGNYKQMGKDLKGAWQNPREISNQIKFNKNTGQVSGSIFFRYKSLLKGNNLVSNKFIDILKEEHYFEQAEIPNLKEVSSQEVSGDDLSIRNRHLENSIVWKDLKDQDFIYYVVYREELSGEDPINRESLAIVYSNGEDYIEFIDTGVDPEKTYRYSVAGVDRLNNITYLMN